MNLRTRRYLTDHVMRVLAYLMAALAIFPLLDLLWQVTSKAIPGLGLQVFTQSVQGNGGGLLNAIEGTLVIVVLATLISAPLGIFGGLYVAEYDPHGRFAQVIRFTTDVLAGVPSIVIGYFGFVALVVGLGWHFSLLAGSMALSVMSLPYILRSTEVAFQSLRPDIREASLALGADRVTTIFRVLFPPAIPGILTGLLLAISISLGETAPLIYTAGWSVFPPSLQLTNSPVGYLTYVIWTFINNPLAEAHVLAYAAAFILIVLILVLNVIVRRVFGRSNPALGRF